MQGELLLVHSAEGIALTVGSTSASPTLIAAATDTKVRRGQFFPASTISPLTDMSGKDSQWVCSTPLLITKSYPFSPHPPRLSNSDAIVSRFYILRRMTSPFLTVKSLNKKWNSKRRKLLPSK